MLDTLKKVLTQQDDDRPRTRQVAIGPSQIHGCSRAVMYQIRGTAPVNQTERLASMLGTAIHSMIEEAFTAYGDPDDCLVELEVPGVEEIGLGPGHIDLYRHSDKSITDWKTSKLKSQRFFPSGQQRTQVQTYGFLAIRAGYDVEKVRLVSIPRDGTFADVQVHEEWYQESLAWAGMDWLAALWSRRNEEWLPEPERSGVMCTDYCEFYDPVNLCPSKDPEAILTPKTGT